MSTTPQPRDGEIHLYCLGLPQAASELTLLTRMLSKSETDRAGRLKNDNAKNNYCAGRGIVREILGGYLGVEPDAVRIATGEHGKPFLADSALPLCFNLSHSGSVLLLVVTAGRDVGVDIEKIETDKPLKDMAKIAFTPREQEEIFNLPSSSQQTSAFYRCWVRKEACLKACGRGFSLPSNSFDISPFNTGAVLQNVRCNRSDWNVLDVDVPQPYSAALAVALSDSALLPPKLVWMPQRLSAARE